MEYDLHFGDCLEVMKSIPDASVDCVLTDPPYGTTACKWDSVISFEPMWKELKRIAKRKAAICLFGSQPFTSALIGSNLNEFRYCWYWQKNQATNFFHADKMPLRLIEEISVFGSPIYNPQITYGHVPTNSAKGKSKGVVYFGTNTRDEGGGSTERFPNNILRYACVGNYSRNHPNEKPVELLRYLIRTYTQEGETVLDFTMGSGSTGVACQLENRNFIGIENNAEYFAIAEKRIADVVKKEPLFMTV